MVSVLLAAAVPARGEERSQWALCGHHIPSPEIPLDPRGRTVLTADRGTLTGRETLVMQGKVEVVGEGQRLTADEIVYVRSRDEASSEGPVHYEKHDLIVDGQGMRIRLGTETGSVQRAAFQLAREHGHGEARRLFLEGSRRTTLRDASYTTCDPGQEDWVLRASKVVLDHEHDVGQAYNAWMQIKGVPVFYTPYVSFPLEGKRKSGFLAPALGRSDRSGTEVAVPYYFNLAPNYDATLTPDYFSKRGLLMAGEFRYLTTINGGRISAAYIDRDEAYGNRDRGALSLRDAGHPFPRVRSDIRYDYVSDPDYLDDYGRSLDIAAVTHLPQQGSLDYQGDAWSAGLLLQSFQTVDETIPESSRPYQRLPRLGLSLTPAERRNRLNFSMDNELVNFKRDGRVGGKRLDLQPVLSLPLKTPGAFLKPAVKLEYTAYRLDDPPAGGDDAPRRVVPLTSVDGGLILERSYEAGGHRLLHTLEPRLFYLYVPRRDQADIPLFDTGLPDFNFDQLFRDNRFTSSDRVGDANQISTALTSRLLDEAGRERLVLNIGQIHYLQDRVVTLGGPPQDNSRSDIVADGEALITPRLRASGELRWNVEDDVLDKGTIALRYHAGRHRRLNLSYRYRDDSLEQSDAALLWPLGPRWRVMGRWNRDILNDRDLETMGGFEYENCCWKFNFLARRYLKSTDRDKYNTTYYLQMEFKGLTSIGNDPEDVLRKSGILGPDE